MFSYLWFSPAELLSQADAIAFRFSSLFSFYFRLRYAIFAFSPGYAFFAAFHDYYFLSSPASYADIGCQRYFAHFRLRFSFRFSSPFSFFFHRPRFFRRCCRHARCHFSRHILLTLIAAICFSAAAAATLHYACRHCRIFSFGHIFTPLSSHIFTPEFFRQPPQADIAAFFAFVFTFLFRFSLFSTLSLFVTLFPRHMRLLLAA